MELDDPDPEFVLELDCPEPLDPVPLDPVLAVEPVPDVVLAWVAAAEPVALLRASAGSWPVTRFAKISAHTARNTATAIPITHLRILRTRSRRAARRSAASCLRSRTVARGLRRASGRSAE